MISCKAKRFNNIIAYKFKVDYNWACVLKYLRKYSFEASFSNLNWPDIICGSQCSLFKSQHQYRSTNQGARSNHKIFCFCGTWHFIWLKKLKLKWSKIHFDTIVILRLFHLIKMRVDQKKEYLTFAQNESFCILTFCQTVVITTRSVDQYAHKF